MRDIFFNIYFFKKSSISCNVNLSNLENVLQKNPKTGRAREWIFILEYLNAQILKKYQLNTNHCGALMGSVYDSVCPKKDLDMSLSY